MSRKSAEFGMMGNFLREKLPRDATPSFAAGEWLNAQRPQTADELKGKVVFHAVGRRGLTPPLAGASGRFLVHFSRLARRHLVTGSVIG
jgi:hypothetical protein